jgi:hypothetical protein
MSHPVNLLIRTLEASAGRPKARSRERRAADIERTAATLHELMGALESRLSGLRSCIDKLDAALASGVFAHPRSPAAINLARTETTLHVLADRAATRGADRAQLAHGRWDRQRTLSRLTARQSISYSSSRTGGRA